MHNKSCTIFFRESVLQRAPAAGAGACGVSLPVRLPVSRRGAIRGIALRQGAPRSEDLRDGRHLRHRNACW